MKKISLIILAIILTLNIFTSMVSAYCAQSSIPRFDNAVYTESGEAGTLPSPYRYSAGEDFDNDYAKNYILSASETEYSEEDKQLAYYCLIEDESGVANELYYKAIEYQNMKLAGESGELITLTKGDTARTSISGENLVYGPIYLNYPYGAIENEERRSWAGAYYAFFDEDGNNISNKVNLCVLENGEYKPVSTEIWPGVPVEGYYKLTSGEYSGKELYIVTSDRYLLKVYMKARSFQIVKMAKIVVMTGTAKISGGTSYCSACESLKGSGIVKGNTVYSTSGTATTATEQHRNQPSDYTCDICAKTFPAVRNGGGTWVPNMVPYPVPVKHSSSLSRRCLLLQRLRCRLGFAMWKNENSNKI